MRKDARIWWRIVIGVTLPLTALFNYFVYQALTGFTPGRLVQMAPHTLILYEYEPLGSERLPPPDDLAKVFAERLEADATVAGDRRIRARIPFASEEAFEDRKAHLKALEDLRAAGIDAEQFKRIMLQHAPVVYPGQAGGDGSDDRAAAVEEQLTGFKDKHPGQGDLIDSAAEAYEAWAGSRGRTHDPAELERMLLTQGRLEFRIAPARPDSVRGLKLSEADLEKYVDQLAQKGPDPGRKSNSVYLWFPSHASARTDKLSPNLIVAEHAGRTYLLLCNQPDRVMLQTAGPAWALEGAYPAFDSVNRPAIGYMMDRHGAKGMQKLTRANTDSYMAILLDDEVCSAPVIRTPIHSHHGIIEGEFTSQDVSRLSRVLAGPSRARLPVVPKPVSIQTLGYTDPPRAGLKRALLWAAAAGMALLVGGWVWAAIAGRLHLAGLLALALPAAAVGWWYIAAWDDLWVGPFARASIFANAILGVIIVAVWTIAGATGRTVRAHV